MKKHIIVFIILLGTVMSCQPNDPQEPEKDTEEEEEVGGCAHCKA